MACIRLILAASALLLVAAAPDPPVPDVWSGTWKLDRSRSTLVGTSFRIARIPSGYHFDFGAAKFDIHDDGAFYPTVPGRLTSLKAISDHEWVRIHRVNGADVDRSTLTVTPDGRTLVIETDAVTPNDGVRHMTEADRRVGAGQGLAGTWRSTAKGINVAETLRLRQLPDGMMQWGAPSDGNVFVVAPNGPPAVNQGPRSVSNVTMSLRRMSPVAMRWTVMIAARPYMEGTDTLQPDGRLVETSWTDQFPDERQRAVYAKEAPADEGG